MGGSLCPTRSIWRAIAAVAAFAAVVAPGDARANTTAYFWLSNVDAGPTVPTIYAMPESTGALHVWARPAEERRLGAFSLDLISSAPGVISLTGVDVLNPQLQAMPPLDRHQLVFDSATGLAAPPDLIENFLGYSFFDDALGLSNGAGMGPLCGLDPQCSSLSGSPTWQIATVEFEAGPYYGATELRLAIGEHGLWQFDPNEEPLDDPDETSAIFGLTNDALNQWDVDADDTEPPDSDVDDRHAPLGLADAVIVVADADFDDDGDVDGQDLLAWQRGLGPGATHSEGDANGDGVANGVDLAVWRYQAGWTGAALVSGVTVPEPVGLRWAVPFVAVVGLARRCRRPRHSVSRTVACRTGGTLSSMPSRPVTYCRSFIVFSVSCMLRATWSICDEM
jgi:hypothetical protein